MTTINSHILFPHQANWQNQPETQRIWQTQINEALPGSETRQAMRAEARRTVSFTVTPTTIQERARFDARHDVASKSGLACAPFFGRGCALSAAVEAGDGTITVAAGAWTWTEGDYVALVNGDTRFDVIEITGVAGNVLTLDSALENDWPSGWMVWPLIFGKFTSDRLSVITSWHESTRLTISQLVAERTVQLGAIEPPAGTGIGVWKVGTTFIIT